MIRHPRLHQHISRMVDSDNPAAHHSMREFITSLEASNDLRRIDAEIDPKFEITEVCHRTLKKNGPALLFENPKGGRGIPILGNLFGSPNRIAAAMGLKQVSELREFGQQLAFLTQPRLPDGLSDSLDKLKQFQRLAHVNPRQVSRPACREVIIEKQYIDLETLPIQTCWPEDAGPLITFGLVISRGPEKSRQNIGIYRQQVIGRNRVIMRWLRHRGGAIDFQEWRQKHPGERFPIIVAIGADPATTLAAVSPIPDTLSEFQFAGLLRGAKTRVTPGLLHPELMVPASAEIVLEGYIEPDELVDEGPFGDHTGYYNSVEKFPVFTIEKMSHRDRPIYQGTYMGRPPEDEPSVLASALNEMFIPLLQAQFPEIVDFYLPPEGCSYRIAVVSIRKSYPGHARRIMLAIWSFLRQFTYTKFVIVTDADIDVRNWNEVIWAMTTCMDPARDTMIIDNTPVDYLDFASPSSGLGSKLGFDATSKWPEESSRQWGRPIRMTNTVKQRIDAIWDELNI